MNHGHFSPYLSTYFVDYASPHHSVFATRALFHGTIAEAPPRNLHVEEEEEEEAVAKVPCANNPLPTPNPPPSPLQPPTSMIAAATCYPDPLHEWQQKPIRKGSVWMRRSDAIKREKEREEEEEGGGDDEGAQFTRPCVFLSFPKSSSARCGVTSSNAALEFDESNRKSEKRTTVMIKNIPNKFSRKMLIEMLDDHCSKENAKESLKKAKGNAAQNGDPINVLCAYDFVYLPMDFRNRCNKGYAFVNFTTAEAARRLYERLKGCKWDVFDSRKILHVCFARIQGKIALMENFSNSYFWCDTDDYLPAIFSPPRNGCSTSLSPPAIIGKRATSLSLCH
ncbi:protein terminal ear1 homolog [Ananas comosus]|uniref:Protein terminal ear1 homolog n=1 Tax=Ananas comosus TaxID=4615 RepID=A0A6P5GYS7_ANACO|nr:protein terminal ear1 homolog [Ananas comosus]